MFGVVLTDQGCGTYVVRFSQFVAPEVEALRDEGVRET